MAGKPRASSTLAGVDDAAAVDEPSARERILAAAEALFAERGFDRTSTASIATAAGVPHGLIFYYYKTKMELLLAVVRDEEVEALDMTLPPLGATGDFRQDVLNLWTHLTDLLLRPSAVRRIVVRELAVHPEVRERALELNGRIIETVAQHLARAGGHSGEPRAEHRAAATLLAMTAGMASLLGQPSDAVSSPAALADVIVSGLSRTGSGPN